MSFFRRKPQEAFEGSQEHASMKSRIDELETQVSRMSTTLTQVMKAYSNLEKVAADNRRSLDDLLTYLTDPLEAEMRSTVDEAVETMTPEELEAYKRNLN